MLNHNVRGRSTFFRCFHFGRCLRKRGHEVTLLTISPRARWNFREELVAGVRIVETPDLTFGIARSGWCPWDTWQRLCWLRQDNGYDVVHGFDCRPVVVYPALKLQRQGVPYVCDWADWWGRGGVIAERNNPFLKYLFGPIEVFYEEHFRDRADWLTVISRALEQRAVRSLHLPPERITRLPSGADVEHIRPLPQREAREALGFPPTAKIVEFVGYVHYDLLFVIESFALLRRMKPEVILLLVGRKSKRARRLARQLGVADGVVETGPQPYPQIPLYLACADVLLLPFVCKIANVGRWPNKVGDYMAAGRPIVTNPTGEMKYLFEEEEIGLLAEDTPEDFAVAIAKLLDDPERAEAYGRRARQVAEDKYAWERLTPQLEAIYEWVIKGRN